MRNLIPLLFASTLVLVGPGAPRALGQAAAGGSGVATKANLDLPFEAAGDQEEEEEAPEVIVFYGQQYEGDFFAFVCDKSSSMSGAPWKKLQQECTRIITGFSQRVQFAIVFFDGQQVKFPPSGKPAEANAAMKGAAIAMVMSTATGHGSCYKEAILQGLMYSQQASSKRKQIIVLGDGQTYCNGADKAQYGKETLAAVAARNTQRAHINSCGIGDVDEQWLRALAAQNNGSYRRVQ